MMLGDKADLAGRMAARLDNEMRCDCAVKFGECFRQSARRLVFTDEADEYASRAERADVAGDIAGAANLDFAARHSQHRGWRFWRNPAHLAIDEIVKHEIADAEHGLLRHKLQHFVDVEHLYCRRALNPRDRAQR